MSPTRFFRIVRQRLRSLVAPRRQDAELDAELSFHLDQLTREKIAAGSPPDDARRAARREFGNVALVREEAREARRFGWVHDLTQDVRYGLRALRRAPAFTLIAVASLGLGIGASTTVLGAIRAILIQPLPFADADRLVIIRTSTADGSNQNQGATLAEFTAWQQESRTVEAFGASLSSPRELGAEPGLPGERLSSQAFTPSLFRMLGIRPAHGRLFEDASSPFEPGAKVIVISHRLWQRRYGGAPDIVGRAIPSDGASRTIVGIMPPDFRFQDDDIEFWIPLIPGPNSGIGRPYGVIARLKPGVTAAEAQADLSAIAADLVRALPDRFRGRGVRVAYLRDTMFNWTRPVLFTLTAAVLLMLTIACANLAGLLLARATTRQHEMWVRLSLGAGRARLVRQSLTESGLLALGGGVLGIGLTATGLRLIRGALGPPPGAPRVPELTLDPMLIAIAVGLTLVTALAFAAVPAFVSARPGARVSGGTAPPAGGGWRGTRLRGALVAAELALATVLLVGAGLLVNSFLRLVHRDLNFDPDRLTSFQYVVDRQDYSTEIGYDGLLPVFEVSTVAADAIARVHDRLRGLPGVEAVAGMSYHPVNAFIVPRFAVRPVGTHAPAGPEPEGPAMACSLVTPDLFTTLRTPIVRGRDVRAADDRNAPSVVVINESAARSLFPGRDALGQHVIVEMARGLPPREVIGVVADIPLTRRSTSTEPIVYIPSRQMPATYRSGAPNVLGLMTFMLRHTTDADALVAAARKAVAEVDPARPLVNVGVVTRALHARVPELGSYVGLVTGFGVTAMCLAAIGVYGVTAFAVAARTREVGIRRALGAGARDVLATICRRAALLMVTGLAVGLLIASGLTRLIASQLIGVTPTDPATFAATAALLAAVTGLACIAPIRRALAVEPASVLRSE